VKGVEIDNYKTDLPIKKGLSSSAAICVAVARAFNQVYSMQMTTRGEMEFAYRGERLTPSKCGTDHVFRFDLCMASLTGKSGRLDQCVAFGTSIVHLKFDGDHLSTKSVRLTDEICLLLVDLKGSKNTRQILEDLNSFYPFSQV